MMGRVIGRRQILAWLASNAEHFSRFPKSRPRWAGAAAIKGKALTCGSRHFDSSKPSQTCHPAECRLNESPQPWEFHQGFLPLGARGSALLGR